MRFVVTTDADYLTWLWGIFMLKLMDVGRPIINVGRPYPELEEEREN